MKMMNRKRILYISVSTIIGATIGIGAVYGYQYIRARREESTWGVDIEPSHQPIDLEKAYMEKHGEALDTEKGKELFKELKTAEDWNRKVAEYKKKEEPEDEEIYYEEYQGRTGDDEEVRHEPNSKEALEQFIDMEVSEISDENGNRELIRKLFKFGFEPKNERDADLCDILSDQRSLFFGEDSRWNGMITLGDIIIYFAGRLQYEQDESVNYWTEYILDQLGIYDDSSDEKILSIIENVANHTHETDEDYYGIFGLSNLAFTDMVRKIKENPNVPYISLMLEFDTFLNMLLEEE